MFVLVATVVGAIRAIFGKFQWPEIVEDMMRTG